MVSRKLIEFMFQAPAAVAPDDYVLAADDAGAVRIARWNATKLGPQPTAQQLADAEASPAYADWLAEYGGDAVRTARRLARELYDAADHLGRIQRAMAVLTVDELNALRSWVTDFKAAVAAATTLADLKARVALLPSLPPRTYAQARAAVRAAVDGG